MTKDTFWVFAFCLPTVAVLTESLLPEHKTYVTDALSQDAFVIKTWTYRGSALVVKVTKGNKPLYSEFIYGFSFKEQENRLFIKYNNSRQEVSLILKNVTRDDEGLYQITSGIFHKAAEGYDSILETWNVQLNVLGTFTNSVSALTIVTPPDRCGEDNSDQSSNITLSTTVLLGTAVNRGSSLCVPIYVIAVIIGSVGFIHLIGCLIWRQRRKIHITKTEQHILQDKWDPGLYLTPISLEPPLTLPTCQRRKTGHINIAQNKTLDQSTLSIDMAQMISKDGYEVVDISNNDDPDNTLELEEIIYESTENVNTPYSDTSGYLTVLGRRETTV